MRYLLVKTENMPILALALGSLDYKAGNSPIFPIAFGEFSILIDKEDKTFFYVKGRKEIDKLTEWIKAYCHGSCLDKTNGARRNFQLREILSSG